MKTIEEKNRMIAEFMEYPGDGNGMYLLPTSDYMFGDASELKYHTSWEWLMPVVEEIENMGLNLTIKIMPNYVEINTFPKIICKSGDRKENIYNAVVEFIEWYNENKNSHE